MTAPLTPALALAYLQELSVDVRAAVVLDAAGRPLAGDAGLAGRALDLLAAPAGGADGPASGIRSTPADDGALLAARSGDGGAIAVLTGASAFLSLLGHDLAAVAQALVTASAPQP